MANSSHNHISRPNYTSICYSIILKTGASLRCQNKSLTKKIKIRIKMKKIGFVVQVLTLIIALPLLSILELNHVKQKAPAKKTVNYVIAPVEKGSIS